MPHDCKGIKLNAGDEVIVRAKVVTVHQTETACNVNIEVMDPNTVPTGEYRPQISFNSRLVEKV